MAYFGSRAVLVNRSSTKIPVYEKTVPSDVHVGGSTAGGKQIGTIYPDEFYTILPWPDSMYSITSYKIFFRNPQGDEVYGYIETSPAITFEDYAWASYQEPYHYYNSNGSTLVSSTKELIDGKTYRTFTVTGSVRRCLNPNGVSQGYLPIGTKLAALDSTAGQSNNGYMLFYKKKLPNGSWQDLISGGTFGFVDLGLSVGSFPSNRPIR